MWLFAFALTALAIGGWELTTGLTPPFGKFKSSGHRPATEDEAYTMLVIGGALLASACFARGWELR
jgi:hypothetical protein